MHIAEMDNGKSFLTEVSKRCSSANILIEEIRPTDGDFQYRHMWPKTPDLSSSSHNQSISGRASSKRQREIFDKFGIEIPTIKT